MTRPSGDHANERWPGPHDGSACSCGSSSTGTGASRRSGATHTFIQPDASETNASVRAVGREPRLADRDVVAARDQTRLASWPSSVATHDPRPVPRHVREVPLVPRERACRRPTTPGPTRSRRARCDAGQPEPSTRDDRDVARVVALEHERDACHRRARPRARRRARRVRAPAPARRSPGSRAGARRRRRRPVRRRPPSSTPPPPYAPIGVTGNSAVTVTAGPRTRRPARRRGRPAPRTPRARPGGSPPGDHRASPSVRDRATAAAEMAFTGPEANERGDHRAQSARLHRA